MLREFLSMTWDDVQKSDYYFKSNIQKHVVQIDGSEIGEAESALFLIYYNLYTGVPMVAVMRMDGGEDTPVKSIDGFRHVKEVLPNEDGKSSIEVVYIEDSIDKALS